MNKLTASLRVIAVPAMLVLLGAIVGVISMLLQGESLRLDEAQSIWQTSHSLTGTLLIVAQDVHVPMYHIILHYWMIFFGTSTFAVRSLSLIFFLLCIPFVYLLAHRILPKKWAIFATALFALSPFMNWYANEGRMYTLLALFSVMNQYFFVRIIQKQKNSWPWYAVTAILGAYSHYFFMFNLVGQALFYVVAHKEFAKGTFKRLILTAVGVAAGLAPWIYFFISQGAASTTRPHIATPSAIDFFNAYSQFLFGFQDDRLNTILLSFWPLMVVVALLFVRRHTRPNLATQYVIAAAILPVTLAFALSFVVTPFFLSRYMTAAVAPLFIVVTLVLARQPKRVAIFGGIAVLLISGALFAHEIVSPSTPSRENYQQVVQDVEAKATPSDAIVLSSPFTVYPFEYYYQGPNQVQTLPLWDRQNPGPVASFSKSQLPEQVNQINKGHDYVYLLLSYDQGYEKQIREYYRDHFELKSQKVYSDDLELLVYRVGYKDPVSFK